MSDTSVDIGQPAPTTRPAVGEVRDFYRLLKPRVMSLVVFTAFAGMLVAPGTIHPVLGAVAILCIAVCAGAAGAINMYLDRDIDAAMARTRGRPIPAGRVEPTEALAFGIVLGLFAVMIMGLAVNWTAAALLVITNLFYITVYSIWLKRRTPQNIVIGGAAGAVPPVIGWAAVTGGVSLEPLVLFGLIFLWTPPHFWALSLYTDGEYAKAGVPMLPVVAGRRATKVQMLVYTLLLLPLAPAPYVLGTAGATYGVVAMLTGILFVIAAVRVLGDDSPKQAAAKRMFGFSILYLFLIFTMLIADGAARAIT